MTRKSFRVGDRVGVVKGSLQGYYGHITDRVLRPSDSTLACLGVVLQGDRFGENNPRFLGPEWFLPLDYVEHID